MPGVMIISEKVFQSLDLALREMMMKSAKEAVEYQTKRTEKDQNDAFDELRKKLKVTRPELKPFRDRVVSYQDEWAKKKTILWSYLVPFEQRNEMRDYDR